MSARGEYPGGQHCAARSFVRQNFEVGPTACHDLPNLPRKQKARRNGRAFLASNQKLAAGEIVCHQPSETYRQERWSDAIREFDRFVAITGSVEQNPVLADCHRALGHHSDVESLWSELAESSPGAALVAEGRIVMAGSLADRGRIDDAIRLLERARLGAKHPESHHLRLWYALADLYERAGDVPRARELFERVARHDPQMGFVGDRIRSLA